MILQCNAAQFDDGTGSENELDTSLNKLNSGHTGNNLTSPSKPYSKQEVFHLLPDLINRSVEINGNPDQGVITALSLMQKNIDTILFNDKTANAHNIKLDSNLLLEIEQLIRNNTQKDQCVAIDHDTVDVIKMMFDIIFEDDRLTNEIKLTLAKLQIPLLKVAILDKTYFSENAHPAEVLVNKLTDAALALKKNDPSFEQEASLIVSRVLNEFSDDASIFKKIINTSTLLNGKGLNGKGLNSNGLKIKNTENKSSRSITNLRETTEKLKSLARKNEAQKKSAASNKPVALVNKTSNKPVKVAPAKVSQTAPRKLPKTTTSVAKLEKKPANKAKTRPEARSKTRPAARPERSGNMNQLIANAIKTRAVKSNLPNEVKEFLTTSWTTVATEIYKTHGENDPVWKKVMLAVDDMIWAFQPKSSRMDKLRLSSIIPGILTTIQNGLSTTRQHSDHKSKLFSMLLSIHAANLKEQRLQKPA